MTSVTTTIFARVLTRAAQCWQSRSLSSSGLCQAGFPLSNGGQIPKIGAGTAQFEGIGKHQKNMSPQYADSIVTGALTSAAERPMMIDCAAMYLNEVEIGTSIRKSIDQGIVNRDDVFLCTKIGHFNTPESTPPYLGSPFWEDPSCDAVSTIFEQARESYDRLNVGPIDMLLVHWPGSLEATDKAQAVEARARVWEGMEAALKEGLTKTIGVSNFTVDHLDHLAKTATVTPIANQIEVHPKLPETELVEYCQKQGIHVLAYCPFASGQANLFTDPTFLGIAEKYDVDVTSVVLSWHKQRGITPLPMSRKAERTASNLCSPEIILSDADMGAIAKLSKDELRVCPSPHDFL